jgi:DNA-binding NarL/FixJ family response regulator
MPAVAPGVAFGQRVTSREFQCLRLLAMGNTNKEIGACLGISEQTVKNHLCNAYTRLGATRGYEALIALGWLKVPEEAA